MTSFWGGVLLALVLAACDAGADTTTTVDDGGSEATTSTTSELDMVTTTEAESEAAEDAFEVDGPIEPPDLDPTAFSDPTNVDHKWFPLVPGTQLVFDGVSLDEGDEVLHRVIFTVTDLTKVIAGVNTVVIWDEDYEEGTSIKASRDSSSPIVPMDLVETEIAFFAQDDDGNVWLMGEYPEEYEDGAFVAAPAWIHGTEGSKAGTLMPADPQPETPSFPQGWAPSVQWNDRGRVFEVGSQTCVPFDCYEDVLIVDEFNVNEPTFFQVKYYAPGVGNVQVGFKGNDPGGERLELVEMRTLTPEEMTEARDAALALEANAYEQTEVYAATEPIEGPG